MSSSTVIDHVQNLYKDDINSAVVYWYFTFTDTQKQNVSNLLCSIIADICSNRRDTPQALQDAYDRANFGQQQPGPESIMQMLKAVVDGFDNVYLIIDALDECPKADGSRQIFLDKLHEIHRWQLSSLHILTTSRKELDIEQSLNLIPKDQGYFKAIEVQGGYVKKDIKKYLRHRLEDRRFKHWKPVLKQEIEAKLASWSDGMFRLVALQMDSLSKLQSESKIRAALEQLPRKLDDFYDRILLDIEDEHQEYAKTALQWIAYSIRPISLKELAEAVIIHPDSAPYIDSEERFMHCNYLRDMLPAGLVTTWKDLDYSDSDSGSGTTQGHIEDKDDHEKGNWMIQFAHFSVKEYLVSARIASGPVQRYGVKVNSAHCTITEACLAYMLHVGNRPRPITTDLCRDFILLNYAATCWPLHWQRVEGVEISYQLETLALEFLQSSSSAWKIWTAIAFNDQPPDQFCKKLGTTGKNKHDEENENENFHPLSLVSTFGPKSMLLKLLDSTPNLDEIPQTKQIGNPLHAAAAVGCLDAVKIFLEAGSSVNREGGRYGNTLQAASYGGHLDIVQLLLQAGADINALGGIYGTALQAASIGGQLDLVQLLLQAGADVNALGGYYGTALQAASSEGHLDIVQLLVQAGADINALGGHFGTALQAASYGGHLDTVQLLLQAGADINAQGGTFGRSPLEAATESCKEDIVEVLLNAGADNKSNGRWDSMYKELMKSIEPDSLQESRLIRYYRRNLYSRRAILALLDEWLAKHEAREHAAAVHMVEELKTSGA